MASKFRAPIHQIRKRVMARLERLAPHVACAAVAEPVIHATKIRAEVGTPDDLPPKPAGMLRAWQQETDEQYVKKFTGRLSLDGRSGLVFHDRRVVVGSSDFPPRERAPRYFQHLWPNRRAAHHETLISLHHAFDDNYFHFLNNVACKLRLVEEAGLPADAPIVISPKLGRQRFFKEAVGLGLFGNRPHLVQDEHGPLTAATIYTIKAFDCDLTGFEWLCDRLGVVADAASRRRLFVQRGRHAPNARRFRNQGDLDRLLARHGVETFDPQEHSLDQQIATFAGAGLVVSPHGAGLTNLMFRRLAPCTVIELFNPSLGSPHYYMMSRQRGFDYHWLANLDERGKENVASSDCDIAGLDRLLALHPR